MTTLKNKFTTLALGVVALLFIPLISMQFTSEVNWTLGDFIVGGILLFGVGALIIYVSEKVKSKKISRALLAAIIIGFILLWAELAVGIFGSFLAGS